MNLVAFPIREIRRDNQEIATVNRVSQLNGELRAITAETRTLRQLLESTLSDAQRSVFQDLLAKLMLQDRLALELDSQMRVLVQGTKTEKQW